jgi:hypothetical protein
MDTQKILDFLQKIMDQLGPMGMGAFRIVAGRIIAESIVFITLGLVVLILGIVIAIVLWKAGTKDSYNQDIYRMFSMSSLGAGLVIGLGVIAPSAIDIFSIDYATINRILHLVGNATGG